MHMKAAQRKRPSVRIGCAGWSVPAVHAGHFAPGASALQRYASRFSMVEINSSFYRPHQARTYERWASEVPADFRFTVKFPQTVSHQAALRGTGPLLDGFFEAVHCLGDKLGALLLQLPPSLPYDGRVVATFLRMVRGRSDRPLACEPRHPSWFTEKADEMLRVHGAARVVADPARAANAGAPGGVPEWTYWRLHGHPRVYYSRYSEEYLEKLALRVNTAAGHLHWVVFDNTAHGHAVGDALRLRKLLGGKNA